MTYRTPEQTESILAALGAASDSLRDMRAEVCESLARIDRRRLHVGGERAIIFPRAPGYFTGVEAWTPEGPIIRKTGFYG